MTRQTNLQQQNLKNREGKIVFGISSGRWSQSLQIIFIYVLYSFTSFDEYIITENM